MLPSGGFLMPKRLVSSVFIFVFLFVFIFYTLRSSLIGSPLNPAFTDPELAVTVRCLAYIVVLTPSVLFQVFGLFIISSPFNYLLTHLHSTILFLLAFISLLCVFLPHFVLFHLPKNGKSNVVKAVLPYSTLRCFCAGGYPHSNFLFGVLFFL